MKAWKAALIPAGACALTWLTIHGRRDHPGWGKIEHTRFAHRGLHCSGVPENSLAAFRLAAEAGCGAELDVHLTVDGYLAVIHDSDLFRMCGVEARVEDLTAAQLGKLRLEGSGEPVPFLEQVVPLFEGRGPAAGGAEMRRGQSRKAVRKNAGNAWTGSAQTTALRALTPGVCCGCGETGRKCCGAS